MLQIKLKLDTDGKVESAVPRSAEELKTIEDMVASSIGLVAKRGDIINVSSMPFVNPAKSSAAGEQVTSNMLYQYMPLIKYALIGLGMLLVYLLLVRPVIKSMKSEVQQHYKTVEQLQLEQRRLLNEEPIEPPLPIDDAITALRREVNSKPSTYSFYT